MSDCAEYYRVLRRSDGGSVSLSSFKGKQPVVVFFCKWRYPQQPVPMACIGQPAPAS
jgi:peroxiredoxin